MSLPHLPRDWVLIPFRQRQAMRIDALRQLMSLTATVDFLFQVRFCLIVLAVLIKFFAFVSFGKHSRKELIPECPISIHRVQNGQESQLQRKYQHYRPSPPLSPGEAHP